MDNDIASDCRHSAVRRTFQRLTFKALLDEAAAQTTTDAGSRQKLASNAAALRSFMRSHGLTENDSVALLLGVSDEAFNVKLQAYEETKVISAETVASYRSRLRHWNKVARTLSAPQETHVGTFSETLKASLEAYCSNHPEATRADVGRQVGMKSNRLADWCRPGVTTPRDTPINLKKTELLEEILTLDPGTLSSKLSHPLGRGVRSEKAMATIPKARPQGAGLEAIRFCPKILPPALNDFFGRLTQYKTTAKSLTNLAGNPIARSKKKWRITDPKKQSATAKLTEERLKVVVGWLSLPTALADAKEYVQANYRWKHERLTPAEVERLAPLFIGKGIPPAEITPAHLVDPELLGEFIEWQKTRNGSVWVSHITGALSLIASPKGFLFQQAECAWNYKAAGITPVDMDNEGWEERYAVAAKKWKAKCELWSEQLKELLPFVEQNHKQAREKLRPILDQPDLIKVVNNIIEAHAADRPVAKLKLGWSGSVYLAIWVRDQLLLRMLATNPLRNRNFREMRYADDNSGNLYKSTDGSWHLRYQPHEFKNASGAAKEPYDVLVPEALWSLVNLYLLEARPILMKNGPTTDAVFVNRHGKPFDVNGLSDVICTLTGRYISTEIGILGIRTHAFRHIIATAWLREHPEDYLTVAHILHDRLKTVLDNYAHTTPNDGLARYTSWLATKMRPLQLSMDA